MLGCRDQVACNAGVVAGGGSRPSSPSSCELLGLELELLSRRDQITSDGTVVDGRSRPSYVRFGMKTHLPS